MMLAAEPGAPDAGAADALRAIAGDEIDFRQRLVAEVPQARCPSSGGSCAR